MVLAPVQNFTKITGCKVGQVILKAQQCLDASSQKNGRTTRTEGRLNVQQPLQFSGIGDLKSVSFASGSSLGENLRAVHEPVGDRYGYRVDIALLSLSAKGSQVGVVMCRPLMMWKQRVAPCWLRER
jgi:hypothetical protein